MCKPSLPINVRETNTFAKQVVFQHVIFLGHAQIDIFLLGFSEKIEYILHRHTFMSIFFFTIL